MNRGPWQSNPIYFCLPTELLGKKTPLFWYTGIEVSCSCRSEDFRVSVSGGKWKSNLCPSSLPLPSLYFLGKWYGLAGFKKKGEPLLLCRLTTASQRIYFFPHLPKKHTLSAHMKERQVFAWAAVICHRVMWHLARNFNRNGLLQLILWGEKKKEDQVLQHLDEVF